jgi:hypothetical protein
MGEDPDSEEFLRPSDGDVWSFIKKVKAWLIDAKRRGIPE